MLEARRLTKRFGGTTALNEVSFDLRPGEIHALCGENGAGKSTLIKLLAGVHPFGSYSGEIRIGGTEARLRSIRDSAAAGIAVIYQELAFIDELSVAANIFLGTEPRRLGALTDRRAEERQHGKWTAPPPGQHLAPGRHRPVRQALEVGHLAHSACIVMLAPRHRM